MKRHFFFTAFAALLVFAASSVRDLSILRSGQPLYAVSGADITSFDENYQYTPLAIRCSLRTPFPADAYGDPTRSKFGPFPYLAIWLQSLVYHATGQNLNACLFLMHGVFPVLAFLALYLLLIRFMDPWISTVIAFMAWAWATPTGIGILLHHLREHGLHFWPAFRNSLDGIRIIETSRFPSPGITISYFLFALLLTVHVVWKGKSESRNPWLVFLVGMSWGLQILVYYPNLLAGAFYVNGLLLFTLCVSESGTFRRHLQSFAAANGGLLLGSAPSLSRVFLGHPSLADQDLLFRTGLNSLEGGRYFRFFSGTQDLALIFLPLLLYGVVAVLGREKILEPLRQLFPLLWILPACVLAANAFYLVPGIPQPDRALIRIGVYFKLFNAVLLAPVFLWLLNPRGWVRHFTQASVIFAMLCLTLLKINSQLNAAELYSRFSDPETARIRSSLNLVSRYARTGETVVSADLSVNYAVPVITSFNTLMGNGLTSYLTNDELLKRLAVLARLSGWKRERFIRSLDDRGACDATTQNFQFFQGTDCLVDNVFLEKMGYAQVHHMDNRELGQTAYQDKLAKVFQSVNLPAAVAEYRISTIHAPALPPEVRDLFQYKEAAAQGFKIYVARPITNPLE